MTDPWAQRPATDYEPTQPAAPMYGLQPTPTGAHAKGKPPWFWAAIGAGLVVVLLAVAGGVIALIDQATAKTQTFAVSGTLTVAGGFSGLSFGSPCHGIGGYSDISGGAQVVIYDAKNTNVAIGSLYPGISIASTLSCSFDFTIKGVPGGRGPYSVEVSHRGKIAFQQSESASVQLTLGDGS